MHHQGNRKRHYRGDDHRDVYETPEERLKKSIINLGEVDPIQQLGPLSAQLHEKRQSLPTIAEGIRIGITEQPYKIPYYAALVRLLHDTPSNLEPAPEGPSLGKQVLEEIWRGFQSSLDGQSWRETRLCVQFLAHLTLARLVSVPSLFELLKSFTAVVDEVGVSHGRASKAALCAAEGLLIAGTIIKRETPSDVSEIINGLKAFIDTTVDAKTLVQPITQLHSSTAVLEHAEEWLDCALAALQTLNGTDFDGAIDSFPQPYENYGPPPDPPFELPAILVPPEVLELDDLATEAGEDTQVKKDEWPQCYLRLFDNDVTPDPTTPVGYVLRSAILDIIDIYEVNRKECSRLLLEYPKWTLPGSFCPRPGAPAEDPVPGKNWQLESTLIETILSAIFVLPESSYRAVYYVALITELCKSSPTTVGPAVGKSIRKLYSLLADGLDVEVVHRFAEWFAVHMSNFGFQWVWKEWIPDLNLANQHPKRTFMRLAVEYEIRLSYHDRILKILPDDMKNPEALVVDEEAPGPDFEYDESDNPYHEPAQAVLNLLRGRATHQDVMAHLETMRNSLVETAEGDINVDSLVRSITVQSLLHIGSRSFSHLLNAIERYLPLLRNLAAGGISSGSGADAAARVDIMSAVAKFWRRNRQMVVIVFDKLMQYQIVEPKEVVSWTFQHGSLSASEPRTAFSVFQWDLLKAALDKAHGRVVIQRRKVAALRKEADDKAALAIASEGAAMEVDTEAGPDVISAAESPQLKTATTALQRLTTEHKTAISHSLDGFIQYLVVPTAKSNVREVITERAWHNRANWEDDDWEAWVTWGWYRHWARTYAPYLQSYHKTLEAILLDVLAPAKSDPAVDLFRKTWNIATGQEV